MFPVSNLYKALLICGLAMAGILAASHEMLVNSPQSDKLNPKPNLVHEQIIKKQLLGPTPPKVNQPRTRSSISTAKPPNSETNAAQLIQGAEGLATRNHESNNVRVTEQPAEMQHLNRQLNLTNVVFFWTDGPKVKVISLLVLNRDNNRVGVLTLPLRTQINEGAFVGNLGEFYYEYGRGRLIRLLEKKLETKIAYFVSVNQDTFSRFSDCLGPIEVKGDEVPFDLACEQSFRGLRKDDQEIIRAFSRKISEPRVWFKLPKLVWILTSQVETDLNARELMSLYEQANEMQTQNLIKRALAKPGSSRVYNSKGNRPVDESTWCNILAWITRQEV